MQIAVIARGRYSTQILPETQTGRHMIAAQFEKGAPAIDLMSVEGVGGKWYVKSNRRVGIIDDDGEVIVDQELIAGRYYCARITETEEKILLYTNPDTLDRRQYVKYNLPAQGTLTIGRSKASEIWFDCSYVSSTHAKITLKGSEITVTDCDSTNGVFVNQEAVKTAKLRFGDVITIVDLTIVIGNGFISINNPDGKVYVDEALRKRVPKLYHSDLDELDIEESSPCIMFYRSPRFRRSVEAPIIRIDGPPIEEKEDDTPLFMLFLPSIGMFAMAVGSIAMGGFKPGYLIFAFAMVIGALVSPFVQRNYQKKKARTGEGKRQQKYLAYLETIKQQLTQTVQQQAEIINENNVSMEECLRRIDSCDRRLWERTESNDDFLNLRLGIGSCPFEINIEAPQRTFTMEKDNLQDAMFSIVEAPRVISQVPVGFSLIDHFSLGVIGNRQETVNMMKSLIFQIAALHSYDEVKFVFIYNKAEQEQWDFVRWLPHVWNDDFSMRYVATSLEEVRHLSALIDYAIHTKEDETGEHQNQHYVVFAFDRDLAAKCEALNTVFRLKEYSLVSVVAVYDELRYLPKDCQMVLELDRQQSRLYDRSDTTGAHLGFVPDQPLSFDAHELAIKLANVRLEAAEAAFQLPSLLTFLEMYDVGRVEHLNPQNRWRVNNPVKSLAAPVGLGDDGELLELDLHEDVHGPHGLIAGMTGSGKSEFIMTFILSLALNYHPNEVAFVLIDYKGGGMANAFANLPHTVGVITNLDGAAVNRSLASVQSELRRRQTLFNAAAQQRGISNIDIYKYQGLYREGRVSEPLPHLFIISDEFAELKDQQPEFMEQLISASRIGRSLGVHLILATQKPSGVVNDQIWANSKFKICLKVQDKSDSMEMIKRPDAAELIDAGRFYLQVGYNELFEMGQSAWAGASYQPSERVEHGYDASVVLLDDQGRPSVQVNPTPPRQTLENTKQLDAVSNYIVKVAREEGINITPLWLEPLADRIYLPDLIRKYHITQNEDDSFAINVLMGEFDDPARQRQDVVLLNLATGGNLLLFGAAGSGKTHFLNSFIYSTLQHYSPDQVNHYLIDFGSETLSSFAPAPHVGDVLISSDGEKIENLFKMLNKEMNIRKKLFVEYGGDFSGYLRSGEGSLPSIVVTINNWAAFAETYEDADDWLSAFTREGVKYGIFFILTATTPNVVRYKLQSNFKQQICLAMTDPDDYSAVFGRIENLTPVQTPGRGLYRNEDGVFEFQTALISEKLAESTREIRQICLQMAQEYKGAGAPAVPYLPATVTADVLSVTKDAIGQRQVPVGISRETLEPVVFDFSKRAGTLVMARDDGCFRFLDAFAEMCNQVSAGSIAVLSDSDLFRRYCDFERVGIVTFSSKALIEEQALNEKIEFLVLPDLPALYQALDYDARDVFIDKLTTLSQEQQVSILVGCMAEDFSSIAYEAWIKRLLSQDEGIWIGDGFGDQYHINAQGSFYQDIGRQFGMVVIQGVATITKMLGARS